MTRDRLQLHILAIGMIGQGKLVPQISSYCAAGSMRRQAARRVSDRRCCITVSQPVTQLSNLNTYTVKGRIGVRLYFVEVQVEGVFLSYGHVTYVRDIA